MNASDIAVVAALVAGMATGIIVGWCAIAVMPPDRRDDFLRGALDGANPVFWLRRILNR